jgi:hypothetical protein
VPPVPTEASPETTIAPQPTSHSAAVDPFKNPTYPQRVHFHERAALEATLQSCDERVRAIDQKLAALASHARRTEFERSYHQLRGARDQLAEAVRRLPLETGTLYEEDKDRFEQALAAFERVFRRLESGQT